MRLVRYGLIFATLFGAFVFFVEPEEGSLNAQNFVPTEANLERLRHEIPILERRLLQLNPKDPEKIEILKQLSIRYKHLHEREKALEYLRSAIDLNIVIKGKFDLETANLQHHIAILYFEMGKYDIAESYAVPSLILKQSVLHKNSRSILESLNNLGAIYWGLGRFGEAERFLRRTLDISIETLGEKNKDSLLRMSNLSSIYTSQGRHEDAEVWGKRSVKISIEELGRKDPRTIWRMEKLGGVYIKLKNVEQADELTATALELASRHLEDTHVVTILTHLTRAHFYLENGALDDAERLYIRSYEIGSRHWGKQHPHTMVAAHNLADVYILMGLYAKAEPWLRIAYEGRNRTLGDGHPRTHASQALLTRLLVHLGKFEEATNFLEQLNTHALRRVGLELETSQNTKAKRLLLNHYSSEHQHLVMDLARQHPTPRVLRLAADVMLQWKQIAADQEASVLRFIYDQDSSQEVKAAGKRVLDLRSGVTNLSQQEDSTQAEALIDLLEEAEAELAHLSQHFRKRDVVGSINSREVETNLPPGSAVVEFRLHIPLDFETDELERPRWVAVLLRPGKPPEFADLGTSMVPSLLNAAMQGFDPENKTEEQFLGEVARVFESLSGLFDDFDEDDTVALLEEVELLFERKFEGDTKERIYAMMELLFESSDMHKRDLIAQKLYQRLFGAFEDELKEVETIYIAPDGNLSLIPFDRLRLPDGRYFMERQKLRFIHSGRALLEKRSVSTNTGFLGIGGVSFGEAEKTEVANLEVDRGSASLHFEPLHFTLDEVQTVGRTYGFVRGEEVEIWTGENASEEKLKQLAVPPRVAHIATHGAYLNSNDLNSKRPMTSSLLALSGANLGYDNIGSDDQNGILFAIEATGLNFNNVELVVMTACDTAHGSIDYSEGVYSLSRAFRIAGAQNTLMTLWALKDKTGAIFINDFYDEWLSNPQKSDPIDALRTVKLQWARAGADPKDWAPYVILQAGL